MSFTIHPVCENGNNVPKNCVHAGPVSLGLLPKDYRADVNQLWRAGLDPSSNLVVYSTTYSRGLVGNANASTPRIWWISGPKTDQLTLQAMVNEVVGRLPERAADNYEPFLNYQQAYTWAKANGYALINCNYPAYMLGDYDDTVTRSLINLETGFLPSFNGASTAIYNLANPTATTGFGSSSHAVPHDSFMIGNAQLGSPYLGIGQEGGVIFLAGGSIRQVSNPIVNGCQDGIIFEGVFNFPDPAAASFCLFEAVDSGASSLIKLAWQAGSGWSISFNGTAAYVEPVPTNVGSGKHYVCVSIPRTQYGSPVKLYIDGTNGPSAPITLTEQGGGLGWNQSSVQFSLGSTWTATDQVNAFFSAKIHSVASWTNVSHDPFYSQNWPLVQNLYSI